MYYKSRVAISLVITCLIGLVIVMRCNATIIEVLAISIFCFMLIKNISWVIIKARMSTIYSFQWYEAGLFRISVVVYSIISFVTVILAIVVKEYTLLIVSAIVLEITFGVEEIYTFGIGDKVFYCFNKILKVEELKDITITDVSEKRSEICIKLKNHSELKMIKDKKTAKDILAILKER